MFGDLLCSSVRVLVPVFNSPSLGISCLSECFHFHFINFCASNCYEDLGCWISSTCLSHDICQITSLRVTGQKMGVQVKFGFALCLERWKSCCCGLCLFIIVHVILHSLVAQSLSSFHVCTLKRQFNCQLTEHIPLEYMLEVN